VAEHATVTEYEEASLGVAHGVNKARRIRHILAGERTPAAA
jgi:hypothetical protein